MNIRLTLLITASALLFVATPTRAQTGAFARSYFSHDPSTGVRVPQYATHAPAIAPPAINYQISGYRYLQSNIRGAGGAVDRQLFVEQWGNGRGLRDAQSERDFQAFQQPFRGRTSDGRSYSLPGYGWSGYNYPLVPQVTGGYGYPGILPFPTPYGAPGAGGPRAGGPGYGSPGYGTPGYGTPGNGSPGYGTPGYGGGGRPGSGYPGSGPNGTNSPNPPHGAQ